MGRINFISLQINFINGQDKLHFIANSSSCTTTELSKLLTSCLTAIKAKVIKYCESVYERSGKNMFCPIKKTLAKYLVN